MNFSVFMPKIPKGIIKNLEEGNYGELRITSRKGA